MRTFLVLVIAAIVVRGCDSANKPDATRLYPVNVNFQRWFNNDSAVVLLDNVVAASVDSITRIQLLF